MTETICQSCSMPLVKEEDFGKNRDGSKNKDYCAYCYKDGEFSDKTMTAEKMIGVCIPFLVKEGVEEQEAKNILLNTIPNLKRWKK